MCTYMCAYKKLHTEVLSNDYPMLHKHTQQGNVIQLLLLASVPSDTSSCHSSVAVT